MTRPDLILLCCLLLASPPSMAQEDRALDLPDTPVGRAVGDFVKALNSGSLQLLRKFHVDRGGDAAMADQDLGFYEQSGGLVLSKVAKAGEFEIDLEATAPKSGRAVLLHFAVDPAPPHPVVDIGVRPLGPRPGGGPGGEEGQPRPVAEVIAKAGAIVDQAIEEEGFSGTVLVAREGQPVLERAAGFANRAFSVKNQIDTKFNLGSINKTFTRLAIAQLMEAGRLSLEDKLGKFLPDFPNPEAASKVTIAQLVEMRSGIGDFFGPEFESTPKNRIRTLADYLPLFARKPLAFEPGTGQAYSNGGYLTLGLIIEKITGQSYFDYVRDHIFKPAGMMNTDSYETDQVVTNLAVGYTRRMGGEVRDNVYTRPARGSSAGGGYSTAPDLLKFAQAVLDHRLTSAPFTRWYFGGPRPQGAPSGASPSAPLRGGLGVAGGSPGVNAVLEIDAGQGLVIVVLTNADEPAAESLARRIRLGR